MHTFCVPILFPKQRYQSTESNSKQWPQPQKTIQWPHVFLNQRKRTSNFVYAFYHNCCRVTARCSDATEILSAATQLYKLFQSVCTWYVGWLWNAFGRGVKNLCGCGCTSEYDPRNPTVQPIQQKWWKLLIQLGISSLLVITTRFAAF